MAENVFLDKALQSYLKDIAHIDPLSREEEHELAIKAQSGDKAAFEKLVRSNLKFVVTVAAKYQNKGLSLAELISEGNVGLIKAIKKFDPEKNIKLISYAVWWIKQTILLALAEKTDLIRIPLGKTNSVNKIKMAKAKIFSELGRPATNEEIAAKADLSVDEVARVADQVVDTFSLDSTQTSDNTSMYDFLEDRITKDPQTLYYRDKVIDSIENSLEELPQRESLIVKKYFGLEGEASKNFAQIGKELGLSRERVRQIQKAALEHILADSYDGLKDDIEKIIE
ncbi:MAG: sigma-70 family RNA polymerase sigma factor [Candidatus Cloacimonadales bacterium]